MKRMSEVFEFPVSSRAFNSVQSASIAKGVQLTTASTYAAHAINHVDALADALDECLEDMELEGKHNERVYKLAKAALAAYRGE